MSIDCVSKLLLGVVITLIMMSGLACGENSSPSATATGGPGGRGRQRTRSNCSFAYGRERPATFDSLQTRR